MRFFGYGKSKIILKNTFNLMLSVSSNHLDTIDGVYSHSLEKIDFLWKTTQSWKMGIFRKNLGESHFSLYALLCHIQIYTLLAVIVLN